MSNNIKRCPHCNKIFFDIREDNCPFCKKNIYINNSLNVFKEMFGEDINPFNPMENNNE